MKYHRHYGYSINRIRVRSWVRGSALGINCHLAPISFVERNPPLNSFRAFGDIKNITQQTGVAYGENNLVQLF